MSPIHLLEPVLLDLFCFNYSGLSVWEYEYCGLVIILFPDLFRYLIVLAWVRGAIVESLGNAHI